MKLENEIKPILSAVNFSPLLIGDRFEASELLRGVAEAVHFSPLLIGDRFEAQGPVRVSFMVPHHFSPLLIGDRFEAVADHVRAQGPQISVPSSSGIGLKRNSAATCAMKCVISVPSSSGIGLKRADVRLIGLDLFDFSPLLIGDRFEALLKNCSVKMLPGFQSPPHRGSV